MRSHLCPQVHAAGVRHPDGEAGAPVTTQRASGGNLARTIQMPQAPRTWIRTGDRRRPWIIGVSRTRQTAMPENAAAEPTATAQAATAQQ
jgi:hypothetical protein